jgi:hypothetical protein
MAESTGEQPVNLFRDPLFCRQVPYCPARFPPTEHISLFSLFSGHTEARCPPRLYPYLRFTDALAGVSAGLGAERIAIIVLSRKNFAFSASCRFYPGAFCKGMLRCVTRKGPR